MWGSCSHHSPLCGSPLFTHLWRRYDDVDINIVKAEGPDSGLTCIAGANKLGLMGISSEMNAGETSDKIGTFSIVNLGMYGTKSVAPIIIEPQAGMLGVGAVATRVVPNPDYEEDEYEEMYRYREFMTVTLSCDHRVVDGAVGAKWLQSFKTMLEAPETMIM